MTFVIGYYLLLLHIRSYVYVLTICKATIMVFCFSLNSAAEALQIVSYVPIHNKWICNFMQEV